jgi:two-component system response regulator
LVEDEEFHGELVCQVFLRPPPWEVAWVPDGGEALDFLYRRGKHAATWTPDLILLNVRLPKVTGLEVLKQVKVDPRLRSIPVVIWTVSTSQETVEEAYGLGAAIYLSKPYPLRELERQLLALRRLFDLARFPAPA